MVCRIFCTDFSGSGASFPSNLL